MCSIPLGSPTGPQKQLFSTAEYVLGMVTGSGVRVGYGDRVGTGRGIPVAQPARQGRTPVSGVLTAKRAPEALQGLEWVVSMQRPVRPHPPLRGPVGACSPSLVLLEQTPASWPIRARCDLFYVKLSQNRVVSPKYVKKAYHSPCFQKPAQKSPLDFLGFPFSTAFSHKELMVLF